MDVWKFSDDFIKYVVSKKRRYKWESQHQAPKGTLYFSPQFGESILSRTKPLAPTFVSYVDYYKKTKLSNLEPSNILYQYGLLLFPSKDNTLDFTKLCCFFGFVAELIPSKKDINVIEAVSDALIKFILQNLYDRLKQQGGFKEFVAYCSGKSDKYRSPNFCEIEDVRCLIEAALKPSGSPE